MIPIGVYYNMMNIKFQILMFNMILHGTFMLQSTKIAIVTIHFVSLTVLSPIKILKLSSYREISSCITQNEHYNKNHNAKFAKLHSNWSIQPCNTLLTI
jgi:hypothetical protein